MVEKTNRLMYQVVVDMGTNTFHLLVCTIDNKQLTILREERLPVRLGKKGINQNHITDEAISRGVEALQKFKAIAMQYQPHTVRCFGTSALRNAHNQRDVLHAFEQATSWTFTVIDGNEEAEYIYYGVRAAVPLKKTNSLIMDIGGGSVEMIIGNEEKIVWKKSFELGGQRLYERFHHHEPITPDEANGVAHYAHHELHDLWHALAQYPVDDFIGSAGIFDTLLAMYRTTTPTPETTLPIAYFYTLHDALLQKNRAERLAMPGMIELRVDMIVVASILVECVIKKLNLTHLRVSPYSLKEGVVVK